MKSAISSILVLALTACSPQSGQGNPRDRTGVDGEVTWRVVADNDGQAAFLSRPGAAPDIVLWCRNNGLITLRAHVFEAPKPQPDLTLTTQGGALVFTNVRRQGGIRAGDRQLVEGTVSLDTPMIGAVLSGAKDLTLTSNMINYSAKAADPSQVLGGFVATCLKSEAGATNKGDFKP